MKTVIAAALLLAGACASSDAAEGWNLTTNAQRVPWENNTTAWLVSCGRADPAACYGRAAALCPAGYTRLDEKPAGANLAVTVACNS